MTTTRLPSGTCCRTGFTLLELLLVVALMSVLSAIAIPQIASLLGDRRLVRAANVVGEEMMRLRIRAMREGKTYIMDGVVEEGKIRVRPYTSLVDSVEAFDQTGSQSALLTGATQASVVVVDVEPESEKEIELPDDVTVMSVAVVSAARAAAIEQETMSAQVDSGSRPILFYPDGTTSTAAMMLKHATDGQITVKMRGITGDVTIGEVQPPQS